MVRYLFYFLSLGLLLLPQWGSACSMYKVTQYGKTMVGNNEDSWRLTSAVWFVPAQGNKHGVVYVGYSEKALPEGGMNDAGLVFDGFSMPNRDLAHKPNSSLPDFSTHQLLHIMEQYTCVEEVYDYLSKRNLHLLNGSQLFHGGMFMFVDRKGHYLTVQADTLMLGTDSCYLLANYNPAAQVPQHLLPKRYLRGKAFVANGIDTALAFCEGLSDTMSECRAKAGDGTLYTSIYDTKEGIIYLYFFHDYHNRITFHLKDELAKGAHRFMFTELFPNNPEYARFKTYYTPVNHTGVKVVIALAAFVLLCVSVLLVVKQKHHGVLVWVIVLFNVVMAVYLVLLLFHPAAFYFPSPYSEPGAVLFNALGYLPKIGWVVYALLGWLGIKIYRKPGFYVWIIQAVVYTGTMLALLYWGM